MIVDLERLAHLDDLELFKTIISSADRFPGLYRFDPKYGALLEQDQFLKLLDLVEVALLSEKLHRRWSREAWLSAHESVHALSFGKGGRNEARRDQQLGGELEELYRKWEDRAQVLDLCVIDNKSLVQEILPGHSYYLMGSLLRFQEDRVLVSYNHFCKSSCLELKVSFSDAAQYIQKTFSSSALSELFWQAEVLAQVNFSSTDVGTFSYDEKATSHALSFMNPGSPVIASIHRPQSLPITLAKFLGVRRVNRLDS